MEYILLIFMAIVWIGCGVVAAGYNYAYLQGVAPEMAERDRVTDRRAARLGCAT